ncbi:MAG: PKD domain-containing protein, partial [Bacteroidales bacterium]|nr:PKD domain-containing protein [Bacteroidales bacterium]
MANTHGFELIIQTSKNVIVKALKGAWKSADCPDQADDTGRIPEFMDIPSVGDIGGFPIVDGQIQIPQEELNAEFAPDVNGIELILGLNTQIEIGDPPIPSAQLLDFHVVLHAKSIVGTMPDTQDVGILLKDIDRQDVWAILDQGHPLDANIDELLQDYVHKAYEDEEIPHFIEEDEVSFLAGTCNTTTQIFDDESNLDRQILTSFPDPNTLQVSIPIYLRMFAFVPNPIGPIEIASPMGIETRIIINIPFEKFPDKYVAKFGDVTENEVTIDTISGPGSDIAGNPNESDNYNTNKATLSNFLQDLDLLLSNQLKTKGAQFANDLGNQDVSIPSTSEIEEKIADLFFADLTSRDYLALWSPTASNDEFEVDTVDVKVFSDSLNIALNETGSGDINAITNFIAPGMEFSIAMSKASLESKIQKSVAESGFDSLPKRFHEDGKDVDLNSLNVSVVNNAIRLTGTVTVIDAILGSIDVDASFTTNVGLHWVPSGALDSSGYQDLKHHIIGDPDVDVDEGVAFWIIAIILAVISFGVGGVLIGIISIVVILIVKAIVENIGSDALVNGATGAIEGITAWPPELANIGRVKAIFFDPVDISTTGLVISGQLEVISSCETTQVVPATTASKYTTWATQITEFKALRIYNLAEFFWNPGDGSADQLIKTIHHKYENSGIYLAKHGVKVTEYGGAESRHFALVRVKNVPPVVNAGLDITVNEGEMVTLEAYFEDVEYLDTHWSIWNFGDNQPPKKGFVEETNSKPKSKGVTRIQHAWCDNGVYYVSVQVIDNNGGVGTDTIKVTVLNVPPKVVTPEKIFAYPCSPITLVGHFTDPGWCDKHTGTWCFGDCSVVRMAKVEETNEAPAAKGTAIASHTYKKCGTYHTECVVIDDDRGVGKDQTIVEVIKLKNSHFNEGFTYNQFGKVANFWKPFKVTPHEKISFYEELHKENFFCEKCLVYDGLSSQRITGSNGLFVGIYQCLGANSGWVYQVELMYMLQNADGAVQLGVDPFGQSDPLSSNIVWSKGVTKRTWSHLLQRICAKANRITIFLRMEALHEIKVECCLDSVEVIAMQNINCNTIDESTTPNKELCIDFRGINPKKVELPAEWNYKGVRFISMSQRTNRIVQYFPPDHTSCLEIKRGLILEFEQPVHDLTL